MTLATSDAVRIGTVHPSRLWQDVVGSGPPAGNELVSHAPRERQVGDGAVQMAELPSTQPELESSETVVMSCDPVPARNGGADGLCRHTWGKDGVIRSVDVFDCTRRLLVIHRWLLPVSRTSWIKGHTSSALEVKA
jgi:hypothetical protein